MFEFLHNSSNLVPWKSSQRIPNKLTFSSNQAILAATLAAHQSVYSSLSIVIKGAGDSGLSLFTDQ
jgi:hypothetical protein